MASSGSGRDQEPLERLERGLFAEEALALAPSTSGSPSGGRRMRLTRRQTDQDQANVAEATATPGASGVGPTAAESTAASAARHRLAASGGMDAQVGRPGHAT